MSVPTWVVTSEPAIEPVSLTEIKEHCRVDHDEEDALLESFVKTARVMCERHTGRALITQTRVAYFDKWDDDFDLAGTPVQSITSLKYFDRNSTETTVSDTSYLLDAQRGELVFKFGIAPPTLWLREVNPIQVTYVCGYGSTADTVPSPLRTAIKMMAAALWEHREDVIIGQLALEAKVTARGFDWLIGPYKVSFL